MKVTVFTFGSEHGWSMDPLPSLDSPETLVVAFSAPEYYDNPAPLNQLVAAFPQSHVIGCSTAGEIFGAQMQDHSLAVVALQFDQNQVAVWSDSEQIDAASEASFLLPPDEHPLVRE